MNIRSNDSKKQVPTISTALLIILPIIVSSNFSSQIHIPIITNATSNANKNVITRDNLSNISMYA